MLGESIKVPKSACLECGYQMDACAEWGGSHSPTPGDFTICIRCANVMAFDDDMLLRPLDAEEKRQAELNSDVLIARKLIKQFNESRIGAYDA